MEGRKDPKVSPVASEREREEKKLFTMPRLEQFLRMYTGNEHVEVTKREQ
jgi:hypothetical protein